MNSYILNGMAGHLTRQAITYSLGIHKNEVYKAVKSIDKEGIITTKEGNKFKLELKYLGK